MKYGQNTKHLYYYPKSMNELNSTLDKTFEWRHAKSGGGYKGVGKTAIFWGQKGRGFYFVSCCMTSFMNGPYNLIGDHWLLSLAIYSTHTIKINFNCKFRQWKYLSPIIKKPLITGKRVQIQ